MGRDDDAFLTRWRVLGTVAEVDKVLADAASLPRWWPAVYLDVRMLRPGDARGVGKTVDDTPGTHGLRVDHLRARRRVSGTGRPARCVARRPPGPRLALRPPCMPASAAQNARFPPARLTTRKVVRARLDLCRRPVLVAELESLRRAGAGALTSALGSDVELTVRLTDAPLRPARALGHAALFCLLSLGGPGSEAVLELDPRLAATLAELRTGGKGPEVPVLAATRFERALLGELLLGVLETLRSVGAAESRWSPRLLGVGLPRAEAERRLGTGASLALELGLSGPMLRGRGVLHLPELAIRAVALGIPEHRPGPGPVAGTVRIAFSPRVCCGAVWGADLAAVAGAAVVLPGASLVGAELRGPLSLVRPGARLEGALGADGFRHARAELRPASQEVTHVDPALSELPVELEVELARVSLSLAELGALQPGAIVPLRVSTGDPVFLRAGDRRVGRAELVEVEGEVAARVLELLP